ncbi:MAG: hypothetical protein AB1402_08860 [Bacillota bacterium]
MNTEPIRRVEVVAGTGRHVVQAAATVTPDGVIVALLGGERPHVGAVALGLPRPSLDDPAKVSSNVAVLPVLGHKDDEVARPAAARAARELNRTVVVVAGLHVDRAGQDDIELLVENAGQALTRLIELVGQASIGSDP